jgi:oxygen-independent coproporphyrinogen-3 oxidase
MSNQATLAENENGTILQNPYPEKIYLPFILYPPSMKKNEEGSSFAQNHLDIDKSAGDYILYLSIPFCRVQCKSCPYFISLLSANDNSDIEDRYVDALIKDIRKWGTYPRWRDGNLRGIYIGGGTGSILSTRNLERLVDAIFESLPVAKDYSLTLEGNARDYTEDKLDYVAHSPINRVSLGVQSFNEKILRVIGSPHAAEQSLATIRGLQARGFTNIQFDMMYNLPGHTLDIWKEDLDVLKDLNIKHFTIYIYRIHRGSTQERLVSAGKVPAMQDRESPMVKKMYTDALDIAEKAGFRMYMFDHFAQPGYENMYNHWAFREAADALGVGAGAYSFINHHRTGSAKDVAGYIETVNRGEHMITAVSDKMDIRVRKERYVIFAFQYGRIEFDAYGRKFQSRFMEDFGDIISRLVRKRLVTVHPDHVEMTDLGKSWHMNIMLEFINPRFWNDIISMSEPNWAMNIPMVDLVANSRERYLGTK